MGKDAAYFRSKSLHRGIEFRGLNKQVALVTKHYMKKRHAENEGKKSCVDKGSLEFTEAGFRVRFKQPCKVTQADAWLKQTLDPVLCEEKVATKDWTYDMFSHQPLGSGLRIAAPFRDGEVR